jgi:ParB-like chromosome segregation protein Spo0J
MRETKIANRVTSIPIDRLVAHPGSPNRMSKRNFARLVRNIERTGLYEPLVVRPCPTKSCHSCESSSPEAQGQAKHGCFEIINGHHRLRALKQLGFEAVDAVIWDVDDAETDILLSTLNRLGGSDVLEKKLALLDRINCNMHAREMAKLLPFTRSQIEKLRNVKIPPAPTEIDVKNFAVPMVFFLSAEQRQIITEALASAPAGNEKTKAARNAGALTEIAKYFIEDSNRWNESS